MSPPDDDVSMGRKRKRWVTCWRPTSLMYDSPNVLQHVIVYFINEHVLIVYVIDKHVLFPLFEYLL